MKISYFFSKLIKYIHIPAIKNSSIDKTSKIAPASHIVDSMIKKYSYVGSNSTVINANIGSFCSIADNVSIGGASHPVDWVSSSPVFHIGKNILSKNFELHQFLITHKTIIENDVWIGSNCLIKSGVYISNGAVIGMGSVVTHDIPPYEIWAGTPAKFIRKRFENDIIEKLLKSEWWDWDENKLDTCAKYITDPTKFLNNCT